MKSNDFRHLCDNVCSKEVSLLCFVKLDSDVSVVSSNNKSEVTLKKTSFWVVSHIKFQFKRPGLSETTFLFWKWICIALCKISPF